MKKKFSRIILVVALAIMAMITTSLPAFAAGTETWSQQYGPWENMRVTNKNTTPVKTMGRTGTLRIATNVTPCKKGVCNCSDNEPSSYPPVVVTCKILSYPSGTVLAQGKVNEYGLLSITTSRKMKVGEKVQIFFDVSSKNNPPGPYRKAHIQYAYQFE